MTAKRPRLVRARTLLALAASAVSLPALGQTWQAGSGNWSDPTNWSQSTVPGQGDTATIGGGFNAVSRTITYDYTGPAVELYQVYLDHRGTGTNTLAIDANTLAVKRMDVGYWGRGVVNQSGGNVAVSGWLSLGTTRGSSGVYNLSGGTLTTSTTSSTGLTLGSGTFIHSGGTHTVTNLLALNGNEVAPFSYEMTGSAVLVAKDVYVGSNGPGRFDQRGGTATVTGTLTLAGGTNAAYVLGGGSLTAAATVSRGQFVQTGGTASLGVVAGTYGTMTVSGTGSLTATAIRQGSLTVESGGSVSITPGGGTNGTSVLSALSLAAGARVDLADNALILDYTGTSPIGTIRAAVAAGTLTSTAAGPNAVLGYSEAASVLSPTGGAFAGQSADATALLVRLTLPGDADLNGAVNFADLLRLAKNYNSPDAFWQDGDFTLDGKVNFADLLALAKNYGATAPADPVPGAPAEFTADLAAAFAAVPEPNLAPLGLAACGFALATRHRRREPAAL